MLHTWILLINILLTEWTWKSPFNIPGHICHLKEKDRVTFNDLYNQGDIYHPMESSLLRAKDGSVSNYTWNTNSNQECLRKPSMYEQPMYKEQTPLVISS